ELDATSVYTGNAEYGVALLSDYVTRSGTWQDLGVPMLFTGSVYIEHAIQPVITVQDGSELHFTGTGTTLYVGNSAEGRLVVAGAEDGDGVVFTSRLGVTDEGSWGGIYIGGADRGSSFRFADISNGGGGGLGNLYVYGAPEGTVTLADSRVARSLNTGVY